MAAILSRPQCVNHTHVKLWLIIVCLSARTPINSSRSKCKNAKGFTLFNLSQSKNIAQINQFLHGFIIDGFWSKLFHNVFVVKIQIWLQWKATKLFKCKISPTWKFLHCCQWWKAIELTFIRANCNSCWNDDSFLRLRNSAIYGWWCTKKFFFQLMTVYLPSSHVYRIHVICILDG